MLEGETHSMMIPKIIQHYQTNGSRNSSEYQVAILPIERKYFNHPLGIKLIQELCMESYVNMKMMTEMMYYSVCAAHALLYHLQEQEQFTYAPASLRISYLNLENNMLMDFNTLKSLELLPDHNQQNMSMYFNSREPNEVIDQEQQQDRAETQHEDSCLVKFLDHSVTNAGSRLLRSNIIEPPCVLETITVRQECIDEIASSKKVFDELTHALKAFSVDIDKVLSNLIRTPKVYTHDKIGTRILTIVQLKHVLNQVERFKNAISRLNHFHMINYVNSLVQEDHDFLYELVNTCINENVTLESRSFSKRQACFVVKPDICSLLDLTRTSYNNIIDDIKKEAEIAAASVPGLIYREGMVKNENNKFWLEVKKELITLSNAKKLFKQVVVSGRKNYLCMSTNMVVYNGRLKIARDDTIRLSAV